MKKLKLKRKLRQFLFFVGIVLFHLGLARMVIALSPNRLRSMLYHAVEPETHDWTEGLGVNVTPEEFAANLDYFQKYYNVVDVMDVMASGNGEVPRCPLIITFDDGYQSVATHAAPALIERSMPATVYLITRAVNGELVWVNLLNRALHHSPNEMQAVLKSIPELAHATSNEDVIRTVQTEFVPSQIESLCNKVLAAIPATELEPSEPLYMDRETIASLQQQNIHFGFHSRDHYNMGLCSRKDIKIQIDKTGLEDCLDRDSFAYPFGYFNEHAIRCLEADNYRHLMTVGNNNQRFSEFHVDRVEVFTGNPAYVFARLEVVEPIISNLRRIALTLKGSYNSSEPAEDFSETEPETHY